MVCAKTEAKTYVTINIYNTSNILKSSTTSYMNDGLEDFVRQKIEVEKCTHKQLSSHLQQCYPGEKGVVVSDQLSTFAVKRKLKR